MSDFNKIISLFIGLFVVIFVIALVLGRVKLGNKTASSPQLSGVLGSIFNRSTPTPTLQPTSAAKPITIKKTVESSGSTMSMTSDGKTVVYNANGTVTTIPKTGPEFILPLSFAALFAGAALKRRSS